MRGRKPYQFTFTVNATISEDQAKALSNLYPGTLRDFLAAFGQQATDTLVVPQKSEPSP